MKTLFEQNGVKIKAEPVLTFSCDKCGAIYQSDEYEIDETEEEIIYRDECFTCRRECIIKEKIGNA